MPIYGKKKTPVPSQSPKKVRLRPRKEDTADRLKRRMEERDAAKKKRKAEEVRLQPDKRSPRPRRAKPPSAAIISTDKNTDSDAAEQQRQKMVEKKKEEEKTRGKQRMTTLLEFSDQLDEMVKKGKMSTTEARQWLKERREKEEEAQAKQRQKEEEEVLLIGEQNFPKKDRQLWTSFNPYNLGGEDVEEIGQPSSNREVKFITIRIDHGHIFAIENINLSKTSQSYGGNTSYVGWTIRRDRREDILTDKEKEEKGEKKTQTFNFSGPLKTLPELHRALVKIHTSASNNKLPTLKEVLELPQDPSGAIDLTDYGGLTYTHKVRQCKKS